MHTNNLLSNGSGIYCDQDQIGPEVTSRIHEVVQTLWFLFLLQCLLLPSMPPRASWGVPNNQLTEEGKFRAWFTDVSTHYAGTT